MQPLDWRFRLPRWLIAFGLAAPLAACAGLNARAGLPAGTTEAAGGIAIETAVQLRCPKNEQERLALTLAREGYDLTVAPTLTIAGLAAVTMARDETARVCKLG